MNTDTVELTHASGIKAVANGVQPRNQPRLINQPTGLGELREKLSIHSLEAVIAGEARYTIDWLANVNDSYYLWPDSINDELKTVKTRTIGKRKKRPILKSSHTGRGIYNKCVKICVDSLDVYLGVSSSGKSENLIRQGFILYMGTPSEDVREKIRNCFSFSLGMYLIYLGHSMFNQSWNLVSFKAVTAYTLGKRVFDLFVIPPAHIGSIGENDINPRSLSRMVNALYSNYDDLSFGHLSWLYWHAVCAPVHAAPVQFGAAIEALQNAYLQKHRLSITKLLDKTEWKKLKKELDRAIRNLAIDDTTKEILLNKAGDLNKPPQTTIAERLFDVLKLKLGAQEKMAWKQRDDAAHGNQIRNGNFIQLVRDRKLLKIRFHRMLLCMTKASDSYYDDYTVGHTVRNLHAPVPD